MLKLFDKIPGIHHGFLYTENLKKAYIKGYIARGVTLGRGGHHERTEIPLSLNQKNLIDPYSRFFPIENNLVKISNFIGQISEIGIWGLIKGEKKHFFLGCQNFSPIHLSPPSTLDFKIPIVFFMEAPNSLRFIKED